MWHRQFLGTISYDQGQDAQRDSAEKVRLNPKDGYFLVLEHQPVITLGRRAAEGDLLLPQAELESLGIEVEKVSRGGLVTAHEPGQLVIYPIVSLQALALGPSVFMEKMVEAIVTVLTELGAEVWAIPEHRGVFAKQGKVSSVGTSVRESITQHGLSINVHNDLKTFHHIIPCGLQGQSMTTLEKMGHKIDIWNLANLICGELEKKFPFSFDK